MIAYTDISSVLKVSSEEKINDSYDARRLMNASANTREISDFTINVIGKRQFRYSSDPTKTFLFCLDNIMNGQNEELKKWIVAKLKAFGYNTKSELLEIIQFADEFFTGEINYDELKDLSKIATTMTSIDYIKATSTVLTIFQGEFINLTQAHKAMDIEPIPPARRRYCCHNIVRAALEDYPNLYGAYYYIPLFFKGFMEHSVLFDNEKGLVYDLANNIALPLEIWKKTYGEPTVIIDGKTFLEYEKRIKNEFGIDLSMPILDEVRRRTKK